MLSVKVSRPPMNTTFIMNGEDSVFARTGLGPQISSCQIRDLHIMAPSSASDWSTHDKPEL